MSRPLLRTPRPMHAHPPRPAPQEPPPRTPQPDTPNKLKLACRLRRDPPKPEHRHPREDAVELRVSQRRSRVLNATDRQQGRHEQILLLVVTNWYFCLTPWWSCPLQCRNLRHDRESAQHLEPLSTRTEQSIMAIPQDTLCTHTAVGMCWELNSPRLCMQAATANNSYNGPLQLLGHHHAVMQSCGPPIKHHTHQLVNLICAPRCVSAASAANDATRAAQTGGDTAVSCLHRCTHASLAICATCHAYADSHSCQRNAEPSVDRVYCMADMMPKPSEESWPREGEPWKPPKKIRSRYRADGSRRRTVGEIQKRSPYVQYWKDKQKQQAGRESASSSSGPWRQDREREPANEGGPWISWSKWSWQEEDWDTEGQWSRPSRDWPMDHQDDDDTDSADWEDDYSSDNGGPEAEGTETSPTYKRSRSTQVSEEFVRRQAAVPTDEAPRSRSTQVSAEFVQNQQAAEPSAMAPTVDLSRDTLACLNKVVDLLESLARAGLPTLLSTFQRSGDFTKFHQVFHTDEATAAFPRVGNWNLALTGSLLCPSLRHVYNNVEVFGSFMEAFTVCSAKVEPRLHGFRNFRDWPPYLIT